jgi:hypothetical protein
MLNDPSLSLMLPAVSIIGAAYAAILWHTLQAWESADDDRAQPGEPVPDRWVLQAARHHAGQRLLRSPH